MREWARVAREELARRGLVVGDAIASELGAFLEDAYLEALSSGEEPERAADLALGRAGEWAELARGLKRLEEGRMERVSRLWVPGLLNAALAFLLLRAATGSGIEPSVRLLGPNALVVYWPWLSVLLLLAGWAAWWSLRHGGSIMEQLGAALFPSLAMGALLAGLLVSSLAVGATAQLLHLGLALGDFSVPMSVRLGAFLSLVATWVVVPGVFSLLGAAPLVLRGRKRSGVFSI